MLGAVYSFVLALVLSHIADAEEEDLRVRFGIKYVEHVRMVPKLFPKWEEIERFLANEFVQIVIFLIINIKFFMTIDVSYIIGILRDYLIKKILSVTDIIAILTLLVLTFGILFYAGVFTRKREEYRLKKSDFNFKNRIAIMGATFVASIIISIIVVKIIDSHEKPMFLQNFLGYMGILGLLIIYFGYLIEKYRNKNNNLNLTMLIYDECGNTKPKTINDLELFDATDKDYCFKDKDGNELIIPIGQVQEIVSPKKDDTTNDTEDSNKSTE